MITKDQALEAVALMAICKFFPASDVQFAQIAAMLVEMVNSKSELDWLVREQCKLDWQGPHELRLLFLSHFRARDAGADMDPERAYFEREAAATRLRIAAWKNEQKLLGEAPTAIDVTPAIKRVDRTTNDLQFWRVQEFLGKESKPIRISATPRRTSEERARLVREMEAALGMDGISRRFGYCAAFRQIPGSDLRLEADLPIAVDTLT